MDGTCYVREPPANKGGGACATLAVTQLLVAGADADCLLLSQVLSSKAWPTSCRLGIEHGLSGRRVFVRSCHGGACGLKASLYIISWPPFGVY